ncbi:MAG TPA: zf-HC2 domain-containing protein [Terriglobia bacterium]|nr:zf-HC2 domain-containing protein [Terriglobia bacterium]
MKSQSGCIEREQLLAYSNHMLEPREEERVRVHLETCGKCRETVAGYEKLSEVLDEWKPVEPSPWFDARARARIASRAPARPVFSLPGVRWVALVACAVLIALSGFWALRARNHVQRPAARQEAAAKAPAFSHSHPSTVAAASGSETSSVAQQRAVNQELDLYKNLPVLENYEMLANFDVLSELPQPRGDSND